MFLFTFCTAPKCFWKRGCKTKHFYLNFITQNFYICGHVFAKTLSWGGQIQISQSCTIHYRPWFLTAPPIMQIFPGFQLHRYCQFYISGWAQFQLRWLGTVLGQWATSLCLGLMLWRACFEGTSIWELFCTSAPWMYNPIFITVASRESVLH